MARAELPLVLKSTVTGLPIVGAAVLISQRSTGVPVTWFTTETGSTSSTSAVFTDSNGRVTAWVPRGAYNLTISGTGLTTVTEPWDAIPASDLGGDSAWFADATLLNAKIASGLDASKFTVSTIPAARVGAASVSGTALADLAVLTANLAAGNGSKLLLAKLINGGTIGAQDVTLMANTTVAHSNKGGFVVAIQRFRPTSSDGSMDMWVVFDGATPTGASDSSTWTGSTGQVMMMNIVYAYTAPTAGNHTWSVISFGSTLLGVQGTGVYDGSGLIMVFENS
jgi:hypothetical protein